MPRKIIFSCLISHVRNNWQSTLLVYYNWVLIWLIFICWIYINKEEEWICWYILCFRPLVFENGLMFFGKSENNFGKFDIPMKCSSEYWIKDQTSMNWGPSINKILISVCFLLTSSMNSSRNFLAVHKGSSL